MNGKKAAQEGLGGVMEVVDSLLAPGGCPWDQEQTPGSLCEYLLEEAYELVDAIRHGSPREAMDEMGDVIFLLVFISRLYADRNDFTLGDALKANAEKMKRRHPHVFGKEVVASEEELMRTWQRVKKEEAVAKGKKNAGLYSGLVRSLPALIKAYRVHSKAASAGFTWESDQDAEQQFEAEWLEWLDAGKGDDKQAQEWELGDLIFTLVEIGRRKGIKANAALDFAVQRFLSRFARMEEKCTGQGKEFASLDMDEKNALWDEAKADEQSRPAPRGEQ